MRHAPLGVEVETKKQKTPTPSNREQDDNDDSVDMVEDSNIPQNLGTQIFNQAREQRQEMSTIQSSVKQSAVGNDDSDYDVRPCVIHSGITIQNVHI